MRPENTAIAFDWALGFGADVLETDVRLSRDERVMVIHDERLERTSDGRGAVRGQSASALERLDAGYRFREPGGRAWRGAGARIVTLDALFERYPGTRINIDIKDRDARAADRVAAAIERADRQYGVTVGSFNTSVLMHFRRIAPGVATAASRGEVAALYFERLLGGRPGSDAHPGSMPERNTSPTRSQTRLQTRSQTRSPTRVPAPTRSRAQLPYRYLQIPLRYAGLPLATPGFIATARARGVQPVYWTVNDESTMRRLIERRVAGIVTDRADRLALLLPRGP